MIEASRTDDRLEVAVRTDLTIYTALELHGQVLPLLEPPCNWHLDLTQVSELDGAGLQLLLMLRGHLTSVGHQLTLVGCSPAVTEALTLCGLAAAFEDHAVA